VPLTRRSVSRYASCRRRVAGQGASSPRPARNLVAAWRLRQCARFRAGLPEVWMVWIPGTAEDEKGRLDCRPFLLSVSPQLTKTMAPRRPGQLFQPQLSRTRYFRTRYFRTRYFRTRYFRTRYFRPGRTCRVCRFHPAGCVRCHTLARRPPECCHPGATGDGIPACCCAEPSFFRNFSERHLRLAGRDAMNKQ